MDQREILRNEKGNRSQKLTVKLKAISEKKIYERKILFDKNKHLTINLAEL